MSSANIKLYTSTYPTMYGEPLKQVMWIENAREYYLINVNSGSSITSDAITGIGLVEGALDQENKKEYENIKNKIFILNKNNSERYNKAIKSKKLNVYSSFEGNEYKSFILYNQLNEEENEIIKWFNLKGKEFKNGKKYELKTGFLIKTLVEPKEEFYSVKVYFENISNKKIVLTGVDKWKNVGDDKRISTEVVLKIQNEWNLFKFNLVSNDFVNKNNLDLDRIILEPNSLKELEFLIPRKEFLSFNQFREKNPDIKFDYNLTVNLKVNEPYEISGGFYYSTEKLFFK